jgi:hypothetical protein
MKHIRILALVSCACFVPVAWGQQPAGKCFNNWSEFHRTNMERWNPCEKVLNVQNVGNLGLKWSYTTGGTVQSSPAVANGVVYIGSADHNVYALNARTAPCCGATPPTRCFLRPPWPMGWFMSAR